VKLDRTTLAASNPAIPAGIASLASSCNAAWVRFACRSFSAACFPSVCGVHNQHQKRKKIHVSSYSDGIKSASAFMVRLLQFIQFSVGGLMIFFG
jgi:hypothetical protein